MWGRRETGHPQISLVTRAVTTILNVVGMLAIMLVIPGMWWPGQVCGTA